MQDLHLVGFTKDHRSLIFSTRKDAKSGSYVVPVDEDLVAAIRAVADRAEATDRNEEIPEPPAPKVESQLSVREVQARLRNGDEVAAVAADAGVEPQWIERFAAPIRAEQRRVVDKALTVPLTRARAGTSAVSLRRAIAAAMAERGVDFTADGFEKAWSAHLVGGDTWTVAFEFPNRGRTRRLEWSFDLASGTLSTTDRFASQLAFVESASSLPPVESTVGAQPTRSSGAGPRGALTSGGLARPGSGRVTTPSGTASSLPPVVRASSPTYTTPHRSAVDEDPIATRGAGADPRASTPRRSPQVEVPGGRSVFDEPVGADAPPRSRASAPAGRSPSDPPEERSAAEPVPPRRPAPVVSGAESAATRPAPRPQGPVRGADPGADRRGFVVADRTAIEGAVTAHPPGRSESVVILRSVVDEPEAYDVEPEFDEAQRYGPHVDDQDYDDAADGDYLEGEDYEDYAEDGDYLDDDWDDDAEDYDAPDADEDEVRDPGDDWDDSEDLGDRADETDVDEDYTGDDGDDDEFSITLTVPASVAGSPDDEAGPDAEAGAVEASPVRAVARRREPARFVDEPSDDVLVADESEEHAATPMRSTVQIVPGSATQARGSSNGRRRQLRADVDTDGSEDDADEQPRRPRRRRREPLRAR